MPKKILLCLDGEPHTDKAQAEALVLTAALDAELTAVYVVDPYLKKFTHEIYAVNRDECRAHLDKALTDEGEAALAGFLELADQRAVTVATRVLHGDPAESIADLAAAEGFDLVVIGGKLLKGWGQRFESRNLPERLNRIIARPLLIVR